MFLFINYEDLGKSTIPSTAVTLDYKYFIHSTQLKVLDVRDVLTIAYIILGTPYFHVLKVFIIGMTGLAAVAGIGFILVRRRSHKNRSARQQ